MTTAPAPDVATAELTVREITYDAIASVAAQIRRADRDEIEAFYGVDCEIEPILRAQIEETDNHFALYLGDQVVALFGCSTQVVGDDSMPVGSPWLIGTRALKRVSPFYLHRRATEWIEEWLGDFRYLTNVVWGESENLDWLRRLGFSISDEPMMTAEITDEDFFSFFMGPA